jgi:hypothetical protein
MGSRIPPKSKNEYDAIGIPIGIAIGIPIGIPL